MISRAISLIMPGLCQGVRMFGEGLTRIILFPKSARSVTTLAVCGIELQILIERCMGVPTAFRRCPQADIVLAKGSMSLRITAEC